jgi:ParB-like chromosome segregation protein Spo0J
LQNPITIREVDVFDDPVDGEIHEAYVLVAGRHRLEAQKLRGETHIDCIVVDYDDLHAELAEIDENLIRTDLTPAQEAQAVARRKAIYEELHPETKAGAAQAAGMNKALGRGDVAANSAATFVDATTAATGKAERTIRQAAARGEALGEALTEVAGTSLGKGVDLDALIKKPEPERKSFIERAKAGEKVTARASAGPEKHETAQNEVPNKVRGNPLIKAWERATEEERLEFGSQKYES